MHTTPSALESGDRDLQRPVMLASLLVALLMLVGKLGAFYLTGSAAIFSDAMESVVHLLATAFAAFSLWYAVRPPDEEHRYGHGKIAYFSSGFEGGLIMVAAATILYTSIQDLIAGPELRQLDKGLLITGTLMLVNLVLGLSLIRIGKRHHSIVLVANGEHVMTDMWTSLGVLIGIGLVWLTGITWLDPVTAIIVALNIIWTAFGLMRQAVAGLMDAAEPEHTAAIRTLLDEAVAEGTVSGWHELRHRRVNDRHWVEVHLLFPDGLSVDLAHERAHVIDKRISGAFEPAAVVLTTHLEPEHSHDEAHPFGHEESMPHSGTGQ